MTCSERNTNLDKPMLKPEITCNIQIADLVSNYPFALALLAKHNLQCIICGEPVWGTLAELASDKHLTPEQTEAIVNELKSEAIGQMG